MTNAAVILPSYTVRDILPTEEFVGRDGYQNCKLHRTEGKRPKWYCKYVVPVIIGLGQVKRVERRKYFGLCAEVKKADAERQRDEFKKQVNAPSQDTLESQVPMSAWLRTYEETFIPSLKPNSRRVYANVVSMIGERFGGFRLCDVTGERVQCWFNELAATRGRGRLSVIAAVFKSVFDIAAEYGRFDEKVRNPVDRLRMPPGKSTNVERKALTPDEIRRLLSVADMMGVTPPRTHSPGRPVEAFPEMGSIVRLGIFCGLRIGEILGLQWGDIRGRELCIRRNKAQFEPDMTSPKTQSGQRSVPLGPVVLARPDGARDEDRIFEVEYRVVHKAYRAALKASGISMKGTALHANRRTYATYMDAAGVTTLKDAMGHSSEAMSGRCVRKGFADEELAATMMAELVMGEGTKQ